MSRSASKSNESKGIDPRPVQRLLPAVEFFGELRELVIHAGPRALEFALEEDRTALCGPRYQHDPERAARRNGHAKGTVVLGGRKVRVQRPRAQTREGHEATLPSWQRYSNTARSTHGPSSR